jgi:hypothetical protein
VRPALGPGLTRYTQGAAVAIITLPVTEGGRQLPPVDAGWAGEDAVFCCLSVEYP